MAASLPCDLMIVDINMPGLKGIEVLRKIKKSKPKIKIIILSMYKNIEKIQEAIDADTDGYILKDDEESVFRTVIENVMKGFTNFSPQVQSIVIKNKNHASPSPKEVLTIREMEIFKLISGGMSHKQIAEKLGITVRTVDFHKRNIKDKLQVKSTAELIRIAEKYTTD